MRSASNQYIFVTNDTAGETGSPAEIDYWPVGATGDVAPTGVIAGRNTGLVYGVQGVVVDPAGEIYVANVITNNILGFPRNSNGNVSPNITISGAKTGLVEPAGLALDSDKNLFVANCGTVCTFPAQGPPSVEEFAPGSNGNTKPVRFISGNLTGLYSPADVAIGANGDIYVSDFLVNRIDVFAANANGNVAPIRVIAGQKTQLDSPLGLWIDSNGLYTEPYPDRNLEIFSPKANGDVGPDYLIKGDHTQIKPYLEGITGGPNGSVYVVDRSTFFGGRPLPEILQFAQSAKGNVAPLSEIKGQHTRLYIPLFLFVGT